MKKINSWILIAMLFSAIVAVSGCGSASAQPVDINPETDKCDVCHMMINDERFAAEIVTEDGTVYKYDDIGCLNNHVHEHPELDEEAKFIHDYEMNGWVAMEEATYVYHPEGMSPMAYNIYTFKNKEDAQAYIDANGGTMMSAEDLENHTWERHMTEEMKKKMMEKHKKDMNQNQTEMNDNE